MMYNSRYKMELRVGNKYRLGRKIGSGSFGDIYLGKHSKKIIINKERWCQNWSAAS